jgi:hypothetical protein
MKVKKAPSAPSLISGPSNFCTNTPNTATYSVPPVQNSHGYTWSVSGGMIITSGQGTNIITVTIPAGFTSGKVKVHGANCKGNGVTKLKDVKGGTLGNASTPSGPSTVCKNSTKNYSTSASGNNITYTWTANNGAVVNSGQGNSTAGIKFNGATSPSVTITVTASNSYCGSSATASKTVTVNLSCRESDETIENVSSLQSVEVYPNPTAGRTTILFSSEVSEKYTLTILNMIGKVISSEIIDAVEGQNIKEFDLTGLTKGIYMISLQSDNGSSKVVRLILE